MVLSGFAFLQQEPKKSGIIGQNPLYKKTAIGKLARVTDVESSVHHTLNCKIFFYFMEFYEILQRIGTSCQTGYDICKSNDLRERHISGVLEG